MAKKKHNFKDLVKKHNFSYRVSARLICGECGKTVKEIVNVWDGDFELDLKDKDVKAFLSKESVKEFDGEEVYGDIFIFEVFDLQEKELVYFGYVVDDDEDEGGDYEGCDCDCCTRHKEY